MALTLSDVKKIFFPKNTRVTRNNGMDAEQGLILYNDAVNLYDAILLATSSSGTSGPTDLSVGTVNATTVQIQSSTGADVTPPAATPTTAGWLSATDKTKLDFVAVSQFVNLDNLEQDVADLTSLSGVASNATNLGTFTGSTIPDNSTIKTALQSLEDGIASSSGYSENGISGNGTSISKYTLGGLLTQNTTLNGNYIRNFTLSNTPLTILSTNNNVVGNVKSSLTLTTLLSAGAAMRSEINGTPTQWAEVRADSNGNLTALQKVTASTRAGVFVNSSQSVFLEANNGTIARRFKADGLGHYIENINTGTTAKMLYIDNVSGELFKGDVPSGSSGVGIFSYDAGNGAIVKATGTGVTFTKASGVGTFTAPIGVTLLSARINGVTADLAGDSSFSIICPTTSLDDFPNVTKINRVTGATPTPTTPYQYDLDNAPMIQITDSTSTTVKVRVVNLNTYSYWALKLNF